MLRGTRDDTDVANFPRYLDEIAVMMGTESRGASNAKAKRELGWELRYPSWRQGFVAAYASSAPAERRGLDPGVRASHAPSRLSS